MKKKNSLLVIFANILIMFAANAALAQTEPTHSTFYGLHFIDPGQSVRISLLNPRVSDSEIIPCLRVRVVFDVFEPNRTNPNRLQFARRISREVELEGGQALTIDTPTTRTGEWVSPGVFAQSDDRNDPTAGKRLLTTLVIRENGRTILNVPAVRKGFDPQPDPPQ